MAVRIKSLNSDSSFLLTFTPTPPAHSDDDDVPSAAPFTVLIDPWLSGASTMFSSRFANTTHRHPACVDSLRQLPEPDLILVSQDKPDHCHEETLRQLPSNTKARIVAPSAAARRIHSWRHFDPTAVQALPRYDDSRPETVLRIPVPPSSSSMQPGELTLAFIAPKYDVLGLHNAIGITYRPPPSRPLPNNSSYLQLPITPPSEPDTDDTTTTLCPSPLDKPREKTISILYSPHGVDYKLVKPYASSHLLREAALPLNLLIHSVDRVSNAWYFGGLICAGSPGGVAIARNLYARHWISAHDEDKVNTGLGTWTLRIEKYGVDNAARLLERDAPKFRKKAFNLRTLVHSLETGEEMFLPAS